jgi:hypothetical protein
MLRSTLFIAGGTFLAYFGRATAQLYAQSDLWQGETFFDNFYFFTSDDPNSGFVEYVPCEDSKQMDQGLTLLATNPKSAHYNLA